MPLWHDEVPPVEDWVAVLAAYAGVQRVLAAHADELLATGLPRFPREADAVVGWAADLADSLRDLPARDPRRLDDSEAAAVAAGLPRIGEAAARLAASGLPGSLQHNDLHLGNAFRTPDGGVACIDLGDALWTHPLTAARIPVWILRNRFGLAADSATVRRAVDAFVEPGTDRCDAGTLRALLPDADRLACLHRAESWRRLQADVPAHRVDDAYRRAVPEWLVDAAAPDPYASAIAR